MSVDYGEIICNAVDEIITAKLQGLQYDITKLCTIVDDSMNHQGKYVVSDGTARYEAYTTDISLKKGNQVLVSIPNGDYNMTKTIKGRVASTDTTPFKYTSPIDTMIKITNNIFNGIRDSEDNGLLANGDAVMIGPLWSLSGVDNLTGYTRLGITANFRSWLNGLDVVSGSYGIKVLVRPKTGNEVYELTFSSADMIGNPYQFEDYFYQEKVFDISQIENIQDIEIYFYQDGNFKNGQGELIKYPEENYPNNLFVDGVKIYLGYDMNDFSEETLTLFTPDKTSYRYSDNVLERRVYLRWIHKVEEKVFELIDENNFDEDKYEIRWFKYSPGVEDIDQYAGKNWERIEEASNFNYILLPEVKKQREQIKVVGLIKGEAENAYTPYFSNLLTFENEELVPDQTTLEASTALSIYCEDNSEGNYFIYNQNGKINNEGAGRGQIRKFKALYQGAEIDLSTIGTVNYIEWWFPKNELTMLITTKEMWESDNGQCDPNEYISYRGVDYIKVRREPKDGNISLEQEYSIANQWTRQMSNNTVICRISINGIEYQALEELRFGKAGTNGTNVSFLIEFGDNENALPICEGDQTESSINIYARLYANGDETVNGIPENAQITWEWYRKNENNDIQLIVSQDDSYCKLSTTLKSMPGANYYILKATYSYNGALLEAYLPIPIKIKSICSFIEGAREVIYNHQGIPNYYDGPYVAYDNTQKKIDSNRLEWYIVSKTKDNKDAGAGQLQLANHPFGGQALKASSLYIPEDTYKVCVILGDYDAGDYIWIQPILVMQSRYDFAMLNEWDGKFKLDEDKGTILSTMLGAGKKNVEDNTYSGVLIGDVKEGSELNDAPSQTGVYGLDHGIISYSLKEDGTATFGANGKGQIIIDGNSGIIKSPDLNVGTANTPRYINTMLIDLDDSYLSIKDNQGNKVIELSGNEESEKYKTDSFLKIQTIEGNTLLKVGSTEYYLQSANYQEKANGTFQGSKIDLNKGKISVSGGQGAILLNPNYNSQNKENLFQVIDNVGNNLISMGEQTYYLQSAGFSGTFQKTIIDKGKKYWIYDNLNNNFKNGSYIMTKQDYLEIALDSSGNCYNCLHEDDEYELNLISFYDTEETITQTLEDGTSFSVKITYTPAQRKESFKNGLSPQIVSSKPRGLKIDLTTGLIQGYDMYLLGINGQGLGRIVIDSSAQYIPFSITGQNGMFMVNWDGTLTCNKVNSLNNDDRNSYPISISDNFYVDANGNCGGSSANFGSGYIGGFGCGSLNASGMGTFESLNVSGKINAKSIETIAGIRIHGVLYVDKFISVDGTAYLKGDTEMSGNATIGGTLDVTGKTAFNGLTNIFKNITVNNIGNINDLRADTLKVNGTQYSAQNITSITGTVYTALGHT